jgi:hypothetical protein
LGRSAVTLQPDGWTTKEEVAMYVDAYLLDEQADHIQRERADAASHARLVGHARLARHSAEPSDSLVQRLTAAFRPTPEPCPTT